MQIIQRQARGFTLIEVMIVTAIIAILASIAIPNYTQYVHRANRAEAKAALVEAASWMERSFGERNTFVLSSSATSYFSSHFASVPSSGTARYTIAVSAATTSGYTLTATPTGTMAGDECGVLSIDSYGVKRTSTGTVAKCWNK